MIFFAVAVLPLFWAVHRNNEHYFRGQFRNKKRQKKDVIAADTIINRQTLILNLTNHILNIYNTPVKINKKSRDFVEVKLKSFL